MKQNFSRRAGRLALTLTGLMLLAIGAKAQFNVPKFLKATAVPQSVAPGKTINLTVTVTIDKPYHIQANPATENYIATEVTVGAVKGFTVGKVVYPKGLEAVLSGDKVSVYEGTVKMTIPVTADKTVKPGKFTLPLTIHYQGCNEKACYPPSDMKTTAVVTVGKAMASPAPPLKAMAAPPHKKGPHKPSPSGAILAPIR